MAIKLLVDLFDNKEKIEFDELLFLHVVRNSYGFTYDFLVNKVIDLTKSNFIIANQFKELSKFIYTKDVFKTLGNDNEWYQFGVIIEGKIRPIIWFELIINNKITLSHEISYSEPISLIKNSTALPFCKYPMWYKNKKFSKYRELRLKRNIYKHISNLIRNN